MKKIIFKKIKLENFLSFGKEPTELEFKSGVTFVTGTNFDKNSKNGVGKTALIIESLSYALFGETYRKILVENIANWKNKDTCIVQLWFNVNDDEYHVIRSTNPSKLFLKKNEKDIQKTIPETEKDILEILGISKDIFTNTLVMTNRSDTFLSQKTALKTKFIEGILSLEIFSKLLDRSKILYNAKDKEVDVQDSKIKELKRSIENDEHYKKSADLKNQTDIANVQKEIDSLRNQQSVDNSEKIKTLIDKSLAEKDDLEKLNDKLMSSVTVRKIEINSQLKAQRDKIKNFANIKFECPTCKRPYDNAADKDKIEQEKNDIHDVIKFHEEKLVKVGETENKLNALIQQKKQSMNDIEEEGYELSRIQKVWEETATKIKYKEETLAELRKFENPFTQKLILQRESLINYTDKLDQVKKDLKILNALKILSSPTGIKSVIIKKIINILNDKINFYLHELDADAKLSFDEFFEEKLINEEGREISYGNLSGGEQKRIDFALLFTFRDIRRLQSNITINISVFDELFDSAIDAKAMQDILRLLKEMSRTECYYIITHRESNVEVDGCEVINIEKRNKISKII